MNLRSLLLYPIQYMCKIAESRERNAMERPDHPSNPVTALRSVPGFHSKNAILHIYWEQTLEDYK